MYSSGVRMENSSTKSAAPDAIDSRVAKRTLIICYGNPLRSDDGMAWHVARHLESRLDKTDTELECHHQLAPEIAAAMGQSSRVLFVDAAAEGSPGDICWSSISVDEGSATDRAPNFTHQSSPHSLLTLCKTLYGVAPETAVVTVAGECFELGESLSETVEAGLGGLEEKIVAWTRNSLSNH
jgi:hydrogenase maturation protease